jgi:multidrug efflux system outer membrane protein
MQSEQKKRKRRGAEWGTIVAVGMVFVSGCAHFAGEEDGAVKEVEGQVGMPADWEGAVGSGEVEGWLNSFEGQQLEALVEEALGGNYSLQAARARLDQAEALARIEGAERLPGVSLSGSARRQETNSGGEPVVRQRSDSFAASLSVSWEVDLWGRVRSTALAAGADLAAAESDYAAVRLLLVSRVLEAWFVAVERRLQFNLAEEALRSFESNLTIVEERFRRGLNPALDLRLARANVASARSTYFQNQRLADAALRQLEVLLGRYPAGKLELEARLPTLRGPVQAGLPSTVLSRRPDLVAARARVMASDARLRASRLSLLPSLSLTGNVGRSSAELDDLLRDSFDVWSLVGGMSAPLFQGGRLRANVSRAEARFAETLAGYGEVLLTAFREVESALASEIYLREQLSALETAAEESTRALELAEERYGRGLVDIITVLEAQRRAFSSRSAVLGAEAALLTNRLALHLALGGPVN